MGLTKNACWFSPDTFFSNSVFPKAGPPEWEVCTSSMTYHPLMPAPLTFASPQISCFPREWLRDQIPAVQSGVAPLRPSQLTLSKVSWGIRRVGTTVRPTVPGARLACCFFKKRKRKGHSLGEKSRDFPCFLLLSHKNCIRFSKDRYRDSPPHTQK